MDALIGARFRDLRRVGKNILMTFDTRTGAAGLWSHLGLTGKWVHRARRRARAAVCARRGRASKRRGNANDRSQLFYVDTRIFGRLRVVPGAAFEEIPEISAWPIR